MKITLKVSPALMNYERGQIKESQREGRDTCREEDEEVNERNL